MSSQRVELSVIPLFVGVVCMGVFAYLVFSSNAPATDQELLSAKSKCPSISTYLPDSVITSYNLKISLDNCIND